MRVCVCNRSDAARTEREAFASCVTLSFLRFFFRFEMLRLLDFEAKLACVPVVPVP